MIAPDETNTTMKTTTKRTTKKPVAKKAKWSPKRKAKFRRTMKLKKMAADEARKAETTLAQELGREVGTSVPLHLIPDRKKAVKKTTAKKIRANRTLDFAPKQPAPRVQLALAVVQLLQLILRGDLA